MKDLSDLETRFIECSEERGDWMRKNNPKKANLALSKLIKISSALKSEGRSGVELLEKMMHHSNAWVAVNAAGFLRSELPDASRAALKKIVDFSFGMPAAEANLALRVWNFEDQENGNRNGGAK